MEHDAFVADVAESLDIDREEAERAARATLATLGERIEPTVREKVAAELSSSTSDWLERETDQEPFQRQAREFGIEEFVTRVGARADVHHQRARLRAEAALDTRRRAISDGTWDEMPRSLLRDYDALMP